MSGHETDPYAKLLPWREQTPAGHIYEAGNSKYYETGSWRTFRPVRDMSKCTSCLRCWFFCPDSAIKVEGTKMTADYDLDHCKGCGICAAECPAKVQAIKMVPESDFRK
jgi:2-oxoacid:acceptor oxidoreductase delta subunit (pyruvate/2-ketoisovalerate family)